MEQTNWGQSVSGVLIIDNQVLLARHTYGNGKGKLIVPGGYVQHNETPQAALKREFLEEVNLIIEPKELIGIRFNALDWYLGFAVDYIDGEVKPDNDEISEAIWLNIEEALSREDVPENTKLYIKAALNKSAGLKPTPFEGRNPPCTLYGSF